MKNQILLAGAGLIIVVFLFTLGRTVSDKKLPATETRTEAPALSFNILSFIDSVKRNLTPDRNLALSKLEYGISRGDVVAQQISSYNALASFWKDTVPVFEAYAFYTASAAKLDKSEKNLTFAARLFSDNLRGEHDEAKVSWEATEAIDLYERAIQLNPQNDDLRIGLGSAYIFGRGKSGDPQETMKGVQELLVVARRDTGNLKAQMLLGVGGVISGQYDKAIERLNKVVNAQPGNVEAISFLADAYASKGDKPQAVRWYNVSKRIINEPSYSREVDERIRLLK